MNVLRSLLSLVLIIAGVLSLAGSEVGTGSPVGMAHAGGVADAQAIPAENDALFAYLQAGSYKAFGAKESGTHPTAGPHISAGNPVRIYLNDALDQSLKAGNAEHPAGVGVVKEMYTPGGKLQGWSVAVKTDTKSDDGKGWYWYEVTSTTDGSKVPFSGKGVGLCVGCHAAGQDFVLSAYPLQ